VRAINPRRIKTASMGGYENCKKKYDRKSSREGNRHMVDQGIDGRILLELLLRNTIHLLRSVARNSDHETTEAVYSLLHNIYKFSTHLTGNSIHLRSVVRNSDH
jgi:hypothetical protein